MKTINCLIHFLSIFDKFLNNLFRSDKFLWNLSVTFLRVTRYLELRFDLNSIQFSSDKKSLWILIKVFIKCFLSVFLSFCLSVFIYFCISVFLYLVFLTFCPPVFLYFSLSDFLSSCWFCLSIFLSIIFCTSLLIYLAHIHETSHEYNST